jgi:hypothetical protein
MKQIIDVVEYITSCVNAISKGFKVVADSWPDNNPFTSGNSEKISDGDKK